MAEGIMATAYTDTGLEGVFSNSQEFSKEKYLTWCLSHTLEHYFPEVQKALDIAISAVESNDCVDSYLGFHMLETLYEAQEDLLLAGENAELVSVPFHEAGLQGLFSEKRERLLEAALADLSKAMVTVAGAIKASLDIAEANAQDEVGELMAEEEATTQPWFCIPQWLKHLFSYKEELPELEPKNIGRMINQEKLSKLRGAFIKAYAKVSPAVLGEYAAPHCPDAIAILYESLMQPTQGFQK